jgi:hypothetical protein
MSDMAALFSMDDLIGVEYSEAIYNSLARKKARSKKGGSTMSMLFKKRKISDHNLVYKPRYQL